MIFQGIRTSIAKKPFIFVIFQGGGSGPPVPPLEPHMVNMKTIEPQHEKTNNLAVCHEKTQVSLGMSSVYPHEETLCAKLPTEQNMKTLIRLGGCPG